MKMLALLDVISVEVAAGRNDIRNLETKVTNLETKVDRIDQRLGRIEPRVEGVETELRVFRAEFDRRPLSLEGRR